MLIIRTHKGGCDFPSKRERCSSWKIGKSGTRHTPCGIHDTPPSSLTYEVMIGIEYSGRKKPTRSSSHTPNPACAQMSPRRLRAGRSCCIPLEACRTLSKSSRRAPTSSAMSAQVSTWTLRRRVLSKDSCRPFGTDKRQYVKPSMKRITCSLQEEDLP